MLRWTLNSLESFALVLTYSLQCLTFQAGWHDQLILSQWGILLSFYTHLANQLLKLYRRVFSITVTMLTSHSLWEDTRKDHGSCWITSDEEMVLLKRRKLLSIFFVNCRLLWGAHLGYLTLHPLSVSWSYHRLISFGGFG